MIRPLDANTLAIWGRILGLVRRGAQQPGDGVDFSFSWVGEGFVRNRGH